MGVPQERCREIHQYGRFLTPASKAFIKDLRLHSGYIFTSLVLSYNNKIFVSSKFFGNVHIRKNHKMLIYNNFFPNRIYINKPLMTSTNKNWLFCSPIIWITVC